MADISNLGRQDIECIKEIKMSLNRSAFTLTHVAEMLSGKKKNKQYKKAWSQQSQNLWLPQGNERISKTYTEASFCC